MLNENEKKTKPGKSFGKKNITAQGERQYGLCFHYEKRLHQK